MITEVFVHKGGTFIFSGKVTEGQVLDKGWSKLETGKVTEIRNLQERSIRQPLADIHSECLFVCSGMHSHIMDGDTLRFNNNIRFSRRKFIGE